MDRADTIFGINGEMTIAALSQIWRSFVGISKLQPCFYEELGDTMGTAVSFLEK